MFSRGQILDVTKTKGQKIVQNIELFKDALQRETELEEICNLINHPNILSIHLFRFFYQNSDLSPKPRNFYEGSKSAFPAEINSFTIYMRIFNALSRYYQKQKGAATTEELKILSKKDISEIFVILDGQDAWELHIPSTSIFFSQLESATTKDPRVSIWGDHQLPYEVNENKLARFDVNVVTLYLINRINDIINNVPR
jgi:hypothetical protein